MTRESESCEGWNSHKTRSVYHFQDSCRWKLASTRIGAIVRQGMSGRVKAYQGISRHTKAYQGIPRHIKAYQDSMLQVSRRKGR
jgi:hypothetical protein